MKKLKISYFFKPFNKGKTEKNLIYKKLGLRKNFNIFKLSEKKLFRLLKLSNSLNYNLLEKKKRILKIKEIPSYKSFRHKLGFPVNGQKTRNNAKTRKKKKIN